MGETQLEKLVLTMEARTAQFEKSLAKIERNTAKTFDRSAKSAGKFNLQMKKSASVAAQFATRIASLGGLSIAGGLAGIAAAAQQAAASIGEMAAEAKRAGVSFEAFQELQYATQKSGVSVDALTDGLKEMQLRADEFIETGKGSAADAFARLGFDAAQLAEGLKKPDRLFETIIARLQHLDKAAQIRVADEIFGGTGGEQFVQLLDRGVEGLRQARQEARDLGLVLSQDISDKAAEINQKFSTLTSIVGTNLKGAVVEVAALLSDLIDDFRDVQSLSAKAQQRRLNENSYELSNLDAKLAELDKKLASSRLNTGREFILKQIDEAKQDRQRLIDENSKIIALMQNVSQVGGLPPSLSDTPVTDPENKPKKGGGAAQRANKVRDVMLALEQEAAQLGRTSEAQELYNALARAGVSLESEQGQAIAAAVSGLQAKRQAVQEAVETQKAMQLSNEQIAQSFQYLGESGVNMLTDIASGAISAEDAMKQMALQIANAAMQAALFGQGPLAGLFGAIGGKSGGAVGGLSSLLASAFIGGSGGGFSSGGYTGPGPKHAPAGVVHKGEVVWSQMDVARAGGVAAVEAMRLGLRGYASGGAVGSGLFNPSIAGGIEPRRAALAASRQSGGSDGPSIVVHISTPDAQSFRKSEGQISAQLARAVSRGQRNL
ncbi:MAG: phage tail tape measure protein [Cohaesibacter sp.]|nr:phage tail tape measure protein [Cohaesibacter sp.]